MRFEELSLNLLWLPNWFLYLLTFDEWNFLIASSMSSWAHLISMKLSYRIEQKREMKKGQNRNKLGMQMCWKEEEEEEEEQQQQQQQPQE